eukprot:jgi/Mesvir1/21800/Mv04191-RA.1
MGVGKRDVLFETCYERVLKKNNAVDMGDITYMKNTLNPSKPPAEAAGILEWIENNPSMKVTKKEYTQALVLLSANMDDSEVEEKVAAVMKGMAQGDPGMGSKYHELARIQELVRAQVDSKPPKKSYYTPAEVQLHARADDCWVSFLGHVYDLTPLVADVRHEGVLITPILKEAGGDISHWFDAKTGDVARRVDPVTNLDVPYTPQGRFVHVPPPEPMSNWSTNFKLPWWRDPQYLIGRLSKKTRRIRIKNVMTGQEDMMEVPTEETVEELRERYLDRNWHARSYTWKAMIKRHEGDEYEFEPLDMSLTLDQNGIKDEGDAFSDLSIPDDYFIPVIHLYYNDDLSVA